MREWESAIVEIIVVSISRSERRNSTSYHCWSSWTWNYTIVWEVRTCFHQLWFADTAIEKKSAIQMCTKSEQVNYWVTWNQCLSSDMKPIKYVSFNKQATWASTRQPTDVTLTKRDMKLAAPMRTNGRKTWPSGRGKNLPKAICEAASTKPQAHQSDASQDGKPSLFRRIQ